MIYDYEPIKIGFFIEDADIPEAYKKYKLYIKGGAWQLNLLLNEYFIEYPIPKINRVFDIIYRSQDAPKAFGICKMCLDYLLSVYDNEIEYKKERKKIASIFKYIEKYEAYYHLYTEGR